MAWQAVEFDDAAKERIKKAADFESRLRIEALLNICSQVGPFTVRPMTGRDALELLYSDNRLITEGRPLREDYVVFLYQLRAETETRKEKAFTAFALKHLTDEVKLEILTFLDAQFNDFPAPASNDLVKDSVDSWIWISSVLDVLCSEYGWTIEYALDQPLPAVMQLVQASIKRKVGDKYSIRSGITQQAKANELNRYG